MVKRLTISFIIILICIFSISVSVAYLTVITRPSIINTFVAGSSGKIIDGNIPEGKEDDYNFNLRESLVVTNERRTEYVLDEEQKVLTNYYDSVMPGVVIAKDPTVSLNVVKNVSAYLFIEVVDTSKGNLSYKLTKDWKELTDVTNARGSNVYVYNKLPIAGTDTFEVKDLHILVDDAVVVNKNLIDVDEGLDGFQLGTIDFYAYVSNASGFAGPSDAFNANFNK